ncbi:hypothetical protein JQX13_24120 [Archangium violaceum]|uniref:hypothetical protein n=1 Tax=Archangium violaceum TaxID=83451 RepID=UPI00193B2C20|nr:hypothetical protein [Archangium violaceum]QRK12846.1 hypothetical protein JQX13_24120 [Archangium violaceum]
MMKLARELGPIFRLSYPGGASIQVISSYELVADACDETRFEKKVTQALQYLRALGGDGLFTVDRELVDMTSPFGRFKRHLVFKLPEGVTYAAAAGHARAAVLGVLDSAGGPLAVHVDGGGDGRGGLVRPGPFPRHVLELPRAAAPGGAGGGRGAHTERTLPPTRLERDAHHPTGPGGARP